MHHPAAFHILNAIIDGLTILLHAYWTLLHALEAQFMDIINNHISAQVGMHCWALADLYFKVHHAFLE
jgi:hypothetical protein